MDDSFGSNLKKTTSKPTNQAGPHHTSIAGIILHALDYKFKNLIFNHDTILVKIITKKEENEIVTKINVKSTTKIIII